MLSILILVLGFALLILGADKFVSGASALAARLGLPSLLIGLTVVAFGTSAPELAVSISAGLSGANELVIGNVLGSNIFNLLIIAGLSATLRPLAIQGDLLYRDWPLSLVATALAGGLMVSDHLISRWDGLILFVVFLLVLTLQIRPALGRDIPLQTVEIIPLSPATTALSILGGLLCIVAGSQCAVAGATQIALLMGLSETVIGLTVVAFGTSLPELVTSLVATRRGECGIAMGNIIGSNLFNILFILSISSIITPISVLDTAIFDCMILFLITAILWIPALYNQCKRPLGIAMVCGYFCYTAWILVR